ncbi:MAG: 6-carboxyhexanoate--CoA ligase [Rhodospirillales bacterium 69-11]|nr:MAG: 6-carboxyhexanoate--CoA ligase [Rhodospirillales bacterium 69-11]
MRLGHGLDALFQPRSIAILGASTDAAKIGGRPAAFLRRYGYAGAVYPVNPRGGEVQGYPAFAALADVPEVPDLAIVALAAEAVPDAIAAAAASGVRAAVVFSSGFSEMGEAGEALQRRIQAIAAETGIRVLGPNCLGAVSVADRAIATFSVVLETAMPAAGALGIVSQSGNLGSYTMLLMHERGIGVSRFMTTGNECDVDAADGIAFMARDPATSVILCVLETCRAPDRLMDALAEAKAAGKPVLVLKIGASEAGQAAAASHTGALAGSDAVFDAALRRAGAHRVRSLEELVDLGQALVAVGTQRLPRGRRVAVLVASGGFGVMLADAASSRGLTLPEPGADTQKRILDIVPYASPRNPIDATAQMGARGEVLGEMLSVIMQDPSFDTLILLISASLYLPRLRGVFMEALTAMRQRHPDRLIALCVHGPADATAELGAIGYPCTDGVDATCAVVAGMVAVRERLEAPGFAPEPLPVLPPLPAPAALATEHGAKQALAAAGLPVLPERVVATPEQAADAATAMGFPVVLKIVSPDLPHKTEVGGIALGLADAAAVRTAAHDMLARVAAAAPQARIDGLLVAPMVTGGTELILGTTTDPVFGPAVMVGLGGIHAEVFRDVAVRPAPVSTAEAEAMLRGLKCFPLLDGARGLPKADLAAAAQAVAALSRFAAAHAGAVASIDINPLLVRRAGEGAVALDALIVPAGNAGAASHGS